MAVLPFDPSNAKYAQPQTLSTTQHPHHRRMLTVPCNGPYSKSGARPAAHPHGSFFPRNQHPDPTKTSSCQRTQPYTPVAKIATTHSMSRRNFISQATAPTHDRAFLINKSIRVKAFRSRYYFPQFPTNPEGEAVAGLGQLLRI
jgi:hypothetical protein